jgi:dTDP-glucose pyrophosphorylase
MRSVDEASGLDPAQRDAARRGLKALIPIGGRPFIDRVLTVVADAGFSDACFVVGPGADPIRTHLESVVMRRLHVHFAVQPEPLGSANAVLAAELFADGDDFALINADNHYPARALALLRTEAMDDAHAMVGFTRAGLLRGNITADRLAGYAIVGTSADGGLADIVEKPTTAELRRRQDDLISMTCWRFTPAVFDACRAIGRSERGEYELPDAVRLLVRSGAFVRVLRADEPVLDLSRPTDITAVAERLGGAAVRL